MNSGQRVAAEAKNEVDLIPASQQAVKPTLQALTGNIVDLVELSSKALGGALKRGSEVKDEAERQKQAMAVAEVQARIAYELAIAERIKLAIDVEIEEHFEVEAAGNAQGKAKISVPGIGAGEFIGSAKYGKVTKRNIKLRGVRSGRCVFLRWLG